MITAGFIIIWTTIGNWILDMFPTYHVPTKVIDAIDTFFQVVAPWDLIIPINEMMTVIIIILTIEIGMIAVKLIVGLLALVRGSGKPDIG